MERIREIKIPDQALENWEYTDHAEECKTEIKYFNGNSVIAIYEKTAVIKVNSKGGYYNYKMIDCVEFPIREELSHTKKIKFDHCIFTGICDWNLYGFNAELIFHDCIFMKNVILLGDFDDTVSFTGSTFLGEKVDFQECSFQHFVFNIVTLVNCAAGFQQTSFHSSTLFFDNMCLRNSKLVFLNSSFPRNAELLDMLGTDADKNSRITFSMADFNFAEIRMYKSDLSWLEWLDCTFECNRFDFNFSCNTLIMQNCKNFRIMTLSEIEKLENLNIVNFVNTGRVLLDSEPEYFINAIKSRKNIFWKRGREYLIPDSRNQRNELYALMSFYDPGQSEYSIKVRKEIEILEKMEREKERRQEPYSGMRIFLSYSWKDETIANDIDRRFNEHGLTLIRDKKELQYRNSIKEFMKQIRQGDYAIIIISDDYLKSVNCMYEITEFIKDENYKERILPVFKNNVNIFKAIDRANYIRYWQNEYARLKEESDDIDEGNKIDMIKEMLRLEKIQRELPDFMSGISDMNLIICDNHISDSDFDKIQVLLFEGM